VMLSGFLTTFLVTVVLLKIFLSTFFRGPPSLGADYLMI
jgi:hypothetical protein